MSVSDDAAFRGFSETEASRMRQTLVHEKPVNLEGVNQIEISLRSHDDSLARTTDLGSARVTGRIYDLSFFGEVLVKNRKGFAFSVSN